MLGADAQDVLQHQAGCLLLAAEPTVGPFVIVLGQSRALGKQVGYPVQLQSKPKGLRRIRAVGAVKKVQADKEQKANAGAEPSPREKLHRIPRPRTGRAPSHKKASADRARNEPAHDIEHGGD